MLKLGLLGCGRWGRNLARVLSRLGALAQVGDIEASKAEEFAAAFGVASSSVGRIVESPGLDGIVIATPPSTHAELAIACLNAGKHVYVEKPLACSLRGALAISAAAESAGKQVVVGHLLRYHPAFVMLANCVNDGAIGRLTHIHASRGVPSHQRHHESVLYDLCPHDVSLALALAGATPLDVGCSEANRAGVGFIDSLCASLTFPHGVTASLEVSRRSLANERRLVVTGTNGVLTFDDTQPWDAKLAWTRCDSSLGEPSNASQVAPSTFLVVPRAEPLEIAIRAFIDACESGVPALTSLDEALGVQSVLDALEASTPAHSSRLDPTRSDLRA